MAREERGSNHEAPLATSAARSARGAPPPSRPRTGDDIASGGERRHREDEEASARADLRVSVLELQSSIAFGLGSLLLAVDAALVRVLGSCLLMVHVVPELHADGGCALFCCWGRCSSSLRRTHAHGRYLATASTMAPEGEDPTAGRRLCPPRRWNQVQSTLFLVGSFLQVVAYGFQVVESSEYYGKAQDNGEPQQGEQAYSSWMLGTYLDLNAAASGLFLVSGLLVLLSGRLGFCCYGKCSGTPVKLDGWIDWAANALYSVGCVCLFAAAIHQIQNFSEGYSGLSLQTTAAILWIMAAILHVSSDACRLCGSDCARKEGSSGTRSSSAIPAASRSNRQRSRRGAQRHQNPVQETSSSSSASEDENVERWWFQEHPA